ncbi:MAG: hypothetical protein V1690_00580 [Candidatus Moraniibacteriota bacterium]
MKTLFSISVLIILAILVNFIAVFVLNFAGLPGALLAGNPGKRSRKQFIFGSIVSAVGQSFVYLAYVAFIVNWSILAISKQGAVSFIIWPVAFLAVLFPLWLNLIRAGVEERETGHANAQAQALYITLILTFVGFFAFAFVPRIMEIIYFWVPYVNY